LHRTFRTSPLIAEGKCLFESLLRDAAFRELHLKVLEQTHSSVPVPEDDRQRLQNALQTNGAQAVSKEERFALLSDADTLRALD
jgi:hypothetical protein